MTTRPKTITINEEHEYVLQRMGWKPSKLFRSMINNLIANDPEAQEALEDWIKLTHK